MPTDPSPTLPAPRGPLTEALFASWRHGPPIAPVALPPPAGDPATGEDGQLALYCCYELHYRGFAGVDERWERHPSVTALTVALEDAFEAALRADHERTSHPAVLEPDPARVEDDLWALARAEGGPSLSAHVAAHATLDQVRELAVHRSAYQRKEADPHSWVIPRLSGRAKSALVEIQMDEYGEGHPGASHAELFADTMRALDLDPTYGAYLDVVPGPTLATVNLISLLGRQRRLRGALVGHLALFEMTSVGPMGRYAIGMRRLGVERAAPFYEIHVEADAHHEVIAARDLAQGLAEDEPAQAAEILFGARALTAVEGRFAAMVLDAWRRGTSSLRSTASSTASSTATAPADRGRPGHAPSLCVVTG